MGSVAILSPNGQPTTEGAHAATEMLVATSKGIVRLVRSEVGSPWTVAHQSLSDLHVSALVVEQNSGWLFASAHGEGGVWVSEDGKGARWRRVSNGIDRLDVYSLATRSIGNDVTIFAGTSPAALYRSDDLGESWRELRALRDVPGTDKWTFPAPPHIAHVKCIMPHPRNAGTIYVCVEQGALLKSEDDGESWIELDDYVRQDDTTYHDAHRIEVHPTGRDIVYLTTGLSINRSDDAGRTWQALSRRGGGRLGYPDFIALNPRDPDFILVAGAGTPPTAWPSDGTADSAVLKSIDGGKTWREPRNGLPSPIIGSIEAMTQHRWPGGTLLMFATGTGEIYVSEDAAENWTCIASGLAPISKSVHYRAFLPGAKELGMKAYMPEKKPVQLGR